MMLQIGYRCEIDNIHRNNNVAFFGKTSALYIVQPKNILYYILTNGNFYDIIGKNIHEKKQKYT